jgi:hypothetical protein
MSSFTSCSGPTYGTAGRTVGCMGKHPSHRPHLLLDNIDIILSFFTRSVEKILKISEIFQHRGCGRNSLRSRGWAMEAPRPKAGASRKGNVFAKVPLPASRKGHFPATRSGSAADPFLVGQISAMPNPMNHLWNAPRRFARSCQMKSPY